MKLRYAPRRVECPTCGVVVERVPWSVEPDSRFTTDFEDAVGYLAQRCDKTSVQEAFGIAWRTVGSILERVVARHDVEDRLANLRHIGVDELSYRKGHRYITLVVDHDRGRVVWAKKGKSSETLAAFFEELGEERCQALKVISMDMSEAYIQTSRHYASGAEIVFDRFHVQKLVNKALDETRRAQWRQAKEKGNDDVKEIKGLRWPLLKKMWNLTPKDEARLASLQQDNKALYRGYLLKDCFSFILDRKQPNVVRKELAQWVDWAIRSRLPSFVAVAKTIRRYTEGIVAYVKYRLTNGIVEGLNNKARMTMRRAFGFHSAEATISIIMLCCAGIRLQPVMKVLEK